MKNSAFKISFSALLACMICLCAWIALPVGGVPMTLQTFGVAFCGFLLGARGGTSATAVYLALGTIGIPVFSGFGGSLAFLVGPTGGFLVGFLFLALFCGLASLTKKKAAVFLLSATGLILCHLSGIFWFAHTSGISPVQSFLISSMPYLVKDILSLVFARLLSGRIGKRIKRFFD